MAEALAAPAEVDMDPQGVYKYILIELTAPDGETRLVVRGYASEEYHADILHRVQPSFTALGLTARCLGGGRIKHEAGASLFVYGYSVGFGRADHTETVAILERNFPTYTVTFSNDGY